MGFARRSGKLWFAAVAVLAVAGVVWAIRSQLPRPPLNVVLITLDTTRADHIGCYGYKPARTTAIDDLAANGTLFENAYVASPSTLPSHAAILTGLYPLENGLHNNGQGRLADVPTLAGLLKERGYATGAFIGAIVLDKKYGLNKGFDVYDDDMSRSLRYGDESHRMRSGEIVVESAVKWLGGVHEEPFFCWVHLFDPHAPYEGHAERFGDQFAANPYDGDIAFVDLQVEALRKHLEDSGVDDDTLIVIAGDHGEGFGEHDELEHGFLLYNSTLRVPLIVSSPRAARPGHRETAPVSLVDVLPSVLDCLEIPATERSSGASFKPALDGQPIEPRTCYSETVAAFAAYGWAPLKSITTADWKYIETTHSELYDLRSDPGELQNLFDAKTEQSDAMRQLLADMQAQMVEAQLDEVALTDAERRALESLGYVQGKASPAAAGQPLPDVKDKIGAYNAEIAARKQLSKGEGDLAITALQKLVADYPDYLPGRLTLGAAFQSQNRLDEAQTTYEEALRVDPHSFDAHFDLARLLTSRNQTEAAIEHYGAAVAANPTFAMAHINLAALLSAAGDVAGARQHFESGLAASPDSTVGQYNYSVFLGKQGEWDAALQHIRRAAELSPRNPQIRFQLATCLFGQGKFADAADEFEVILDLNPGYPKAAEQLREAARRAAGSR